MNRFIHNLDLFKIQIYSNKEKLEYKKECQIEKIELSKFNKEIKIEYDDTNLSIEQKKICYKNFKNKFIINDKQYQNLNDRI